MIGCSCMLMLMSCYPEWLTWKASCFFFKWPTMFMGDKMMLKTTLRCFPESLDPACVSLLLSAEMRQPSWHARSISQKHRNNLFFSRLGVDVSSSKSGSALRWPACHSANSFTIFSHTAPPLCSVHAWIWVRTQSLLHPGNLFLR